VLGWHCPKVIMPCYLILPLVSFLQPRRRVIRRESAVLRSTEFKKDEEGKP